MTLLKTYTPLPLEVRIGVILFHVLHCSVSIYTCLGCLALPQILKALAQVASVIDARDIVYRSWRHSRSVSSHHHLHRVVQHEAPLVASEALPGHG